MAAKSVLIVDDEKNVRATLAQAMEALRLETSSAVNGEEALAKLRDRGFGLILLDLKMPGMDGIEVLRRVRETRPEVRVIIITAHGTIDSAVEAMKLGAVDFIQKPFTPREIRELVEKVLQRDSLDEQKARGYESRIELAKRCINDRNFEGAMEHLRHAIAHDAARPEAFNMLGVLYEIMGDRLEAQKNYRAALALDATYRPADENLSRTTGLKPGHGPDLDGADHL